MATETKTITKTRFNREYNNYGKRGHRTVDCWENKRKKKDNDGKPLCGIHIMWRRSRI